MAESLDTKTSTALTMFGACTFLALGFVGLAFATNLPSSTPSNTYLEVWGEGIGLMVLGLVVVISGVLIGLTKWPSAGGMLGVFASIVAALFSVVFFGATTSIQALGSSGADLIFLIDIGTIVTLFVGFPLAMAGSFGGFKSEGAETPSS